MCVQLRQKVEYQLMDKNEFTVLCAQNQEWHELGRKWARDDRGPEMAGYRLNYKQTTECLGTPKKLAAHQTSQDL